MEIVYARGLVALTSSIMKHFGLATTHRTLPEADEFLGQQYRNVVLLLFDGMGVSVLDMLPSNSFLRKHLVWTIQSVFPPTTTAATTSVMTGLEPLEHGWLGWSSWFYEKALSGELSPAEYAEYLKKVNRTVHGRNVNLYPNTSNGKPAADFCVAERYMPFESVLDKLNNRGIPAFHISPYSKPCAETVDDLFATVSTLCEYPERKYIYGYSPLPDYGIHDFGIGHPTVLNQLKRIDIGLEILASSLTDTLIIVTADHGMINTKYVFMDDHPEVKECLLREPSLEGRAMSLFIKPGIRDFAERFNAAYGDIYDLIPHRRALKLFGSGNAHPLSASFIGDYIAVAKTGVTLSYDFDPHPFKAAHGGGTIDELMIPLIVIKSKEK